MSGIPELNSGKYYQNNVGKCIEINVQLVKK